MPDKEPETYKKFERLTEGLLAVPKKSLDKQVARYNAKKQKRKAKRKKD